MPGKGFVPAPPCVIRFQTLFVTSPIYFSSRPTCFFVARGAYPLLIIWSVPPTAYTPPRFFLQFFPICEVSIRFYLECNVLDRLLV